MNFVQPFERRRSNPEGSSSCYSSRTTTPFRSSYIFKSGDGNPQEIVPSSPSSSLSPEEMLELRKELKSSKVVTTAGIREVTSKFIATRRKSSSDIHPDINNPSLETAASATQQKQPQERRRSSKILLDSVQSIFSAVNSSSGSDAKQKQKQQQQQKDQNASNEYCILKANGALSIAEHDSMHITKRYGISSSTENGNDGSEGSFKFLQMGNNSLICGFQVDGTDNNNKSLVLINENEDVDQPHQKDEKISKADEDFKLILKAAGASNSSGISLMFPEKEAVNSKSSQVSKLSDCNGRTCSITLDDAEGSQRFEEYLGNSLICGFNKEESKEEETTKENNKREKELTKKVNNKEIENFALILEAAGASDPNIIVSVS